MVLRNVTEGTLTAPEHVPGLAGKNYWTSLRSATQRGISRKLSFDKIFLGASVNCKYFQCLSLLVTSHILTQNTIYLSLPVTIYPASNV